MVASARVSVVAAVLLSALGADAQPSLERFRPLEIGDQWVFSERADGRISHYFEVEVVRDTVYNGDPYRVVTCTDFDANDQPEGATRYVARVTTDGEFDTHLLPTTQHCRTQYLSNLSLQSVQDPPEVVIGGLPYAVEQRRWQGGNPNAEFATDIGMIWFGGTIMMPGGQTSSFGEVLEYAFVGGREYGVLPVASEPDVPSSAALTVTVAPNPASGVVRIGLGLGAPGAIRLDVFDMVGRLVHTVPAGRRSAGQTTIALDTSGWSAGPYIVRASTPDRRHATARLVRVD